MAGGGGGSSSGGGGSSGGVGAASSATVMVGAWGAAPSGGVGSMGAEKGESLRRAAAWMEEEKEAGKKVSVRTAADRFGLPKTTLHRFLNKVQGGADGGPSGEGGGKLETGKSEDGKKRDKLEISFLLQEEQGGSRRGAKAAAVGGGGGGRGGGGAAPGSAAVAAEGRREVVEVEVAMFSSSSASTEAAKSKKRTKTADSSDPMSRGTMTIEDMERVEPPVTSRQQQTRLKNLNREIVTMRTTLNDLNERVKVLEEQHDNPSHTSPSQLATSTRS